MLRRQRGLIRLVAMLAALLMVAAACGNDDDDTDVTTDTTAPGDGAAGGASVDGVLKLGAVLPFTGDLAAFGPGIFAGADLAVDDINAAGGVLDGDVELLRGDSATDPAESSNVVERFISSENVDGIIGPAGTDQVLLGAFDPVIDGGRLLCTPSATAAALSVKEDDGYVFRTTPSDQFQSRLLAQKISGEGHETVAIIFRDDEYGQGFAEATEAELTAAGLDVVAAAPFDPNASPDPVIDDAVADGEPDAWVLITYPEEGGQLLNAMVEKGFGPTDTALFVTDGLADETLAAAVSPDDPGVLEGMQGTRPGGAGADTTEFDGRVTQEKGAENTTFAAATYDCVNLIALAAYQEGTDDPEVLKGAMADITRDGEKCIDFVSCKELIDAGTDIDFDGLTGFDFNDLGEPDEGSYEFFRFTAEGTLEVLDTVVLTSD